MEANTCMWEQLVAEVALASGCTYDIAMGLSVSCWHSYSHTCKDNVNRQTHATAVDICYSHIISTFVFVGGALYSANTSTTLINFDGVNGCIFEALQYFQPHF